MIRCIVLSLLLAPVASLDADVVIVGAGTSGLVAAKALVEKNPKLKIHVLEQRDHVGGRTKNLDVPGYPGVIMEGGGTWLGPTQYVNFQLGVLLHQSFCCYQPACTC